jgi:hypothetical protein
LNNNNILFLDKYLIIVVRSKSKSSSHSNININNLPLNKLCVFHEDQKTLAYEFNNIVECCRTLYPIKSKNLSDEDLTKNKNIQHVLRVINKNIVTTTETGKFYLFKNSNYSSNLSIEV